MDADGKGGGAMCWRENDRWGEIVISSQEDLERLVREWGFVPLLKNWVPCFSVEEHTLPELWFADGVDGPWEWKGPSIQNTGCAYGKFFGGKAGFISGEWYPDFANYRRDGYDFDARYDDGLARNLDKRVYDALLEHQPLLSKEWRKLTGIEKRGEFDAVVTRLQMQGYVVTVNFEYATDKNGKPYGWGLARYATPEAAFGEVFTEKVYQRSPEESRQEIETYLRQLLPWATARQIKWIVG